tara:strand:+ start:1830 stop:2414 length:585 start_codon:yes stop_codon:yes gene_type:complete
MITIQSKEELLTVLDSYYLPISTWGKNATKTVEHLLKEIDEEECILEAVINYDYEPWIVQLCRSIHVARVFVVTKIHNDLLFLRESKQVFKDGSERERHTMSSIGEKIAKGENPMQAAIRGAREELGLDLGDYLQSVSTEVHGSVKQSSSYPGLLTRKCFYNFFVMLPKEFYDPDGYREKQEDKITYFDWQKII